MIQIKPKAFFFDFDGVICDSEKFHMFSTLRVLKKHDIEFTEDYYFKELLGFDDKDLFKHLFNQEDKDLDQQTLKQLIRDKNQMFLDVIEKKAVFFDGVIDLIQKLFSKKISLAVVSGALSNEVEHCLKKGELSQYFLFSICADHVTRSKPSSECYARAYERMLKHVPDLKLVDCWALEDSPSGLIAASGAGMKTIGITNSATEEDLGMADHVIKHYSEIEIP